MVKPRNLVILSDHYYYLNNVVFIVGHMHAGSTDNNSVTLYIDKDDFTCKKPVWLLTGTATLLFLAFLDVALIEEVQEENSVR